MKLGVVILAAGQGTRMKSNLPKVLHSLAGKPMLAHVVAAARQLQPHKVIVVYGHGGDKVQQALPDTDLLWVEQAEQHGTGHAVQQALPLLDDVDRVLILYGDVPLINPNTLRELIDRNTALALLTVMLDDPSGYGRIIRDSDRVIQAIVEQKDATPDQLAVTEINTGIMSVSQPQLNNWLGRLSNDNAQGEYYLTDIVGFAVEAAVMVEASHPLSDMEVIGVNDRMQLAQLERRFQMANATRLMQQGVTLVDPARFDLRGQLSPGKDVYIDVNVIIEGDVELGDGVCIGANTVLRNCKVAQGVSILENCVIEDADIGAACKIGPFSRIRPGTVLEGEAHIGNFVEIKNSTIAPGSKVNHLSYIGDSLLGSGVNIGAGTITCNYDGANKHRTVIGDGAFIGSNSALVAPVQIAEGATIGAGSVISKDAEANKLTLARARQVTIENWQRPVKNKK
jgi:bifunctional UDP-N-acetylglucosamine pyrophosphorylase/glucosamine-1-phosphate N-acetyltransferase